MPKINIPIVAKDAVNLWTFQASDPLHKDSNTATGATITETKTHTTQADFEATGSGGFNYDTTTVPGSIKPSSGAETSLYRSARIDLGLKTKIATSTITKTTPTGADLKVFMRSGNTTTIDKNEIKHTNRSEFNAGLTKVDIEVDTTQSFLNGVSPDWGAGDWLNQINAKNNITGYNWQNHQLAIDHGVVTDASVFAYFPSVIKDSDIYKMWWTAYKCTHLLLHLHRWNHLVWTYPRNRSWRCR